MIPTIPTSGKYKTDLYSAEQQISGTLTLANGETVEITSDNIIQNSLSFRESAVWSGQFGVGGFAADQLDIALDIEIANRALLTSAEISLTAEYSFDDGKSQSIDIGRFYIDDSTVKRTRNGVSFTAYNGAIVFDKNVPKTAEYKNHTPYALMSAACSACGVQLSNTQAEIQAMPNGKTLFTWAQQENQLTYRDMVSYTLQLLGAFGRINRSTGKFEVVSFSSTPDFEITGDNAIKRDVSDGTVKITGAKFGDITVGGSGFTLDFTENPLLTASSAKTAITNVVSGLSGIEFCNANITWFGDLSVQAGDCFTYAQDYLLGGSRKIIVMDSVWKSHGNCTITSYGDIAASAYSPVSKLALAQAETLAYVKANYVMTKVLEADYIKAKDIEANYAKITQLEASEADITTLNTQVANITTIMAGSVGTGSLQTIHLTAQNATVADEFAVDILAAKISVGDLKSGTISTNKFEISSDSGKFILSDNTLQISDNSSRVRVQIGKDGTGDYSMYVWDSAGNLMFDALGLHEHGIKSGIIRNDMVAENAGINGGKIDMESLFSTMNGSAFFIKSSKVLYNEKDQTLDVAFNSLSTTVSKVKSTADAAADDIVKINNTVTAQSTQISTIQGQISQKIWQDDITYAVNGISVGGTNHLIRTGDNSDVIYGSTAATTKVEKLDGGVLRFNGMGAAYMGIYYKMPDMLTVNGSSFSSPMCGNEFVFSCDIRCADTALSAVEYIQFAIFGTNDEKTYKRIKYDTYKLYPNQVSGINSETWSRFVSVIKVPEMAKWKDTGITDTFTKYVMTFGFFPSDGLATGSWFDVRRCKMESGNKATDWCAAPDDAESEITALQTRCSTIEQTAEGISQTVSNIQTDLSASYSTTEQVVSLIDQKADEINLSVEQTVGGISIGTRNIVLNSSGNLDDTSNWSPTSGLTVSIVTDDGVHGQNSIYLIPSAGLTSRSLLRQTVTDRLGMSDMTNVTLSFWYRASSASTSSGVGAFLRLTDDSGGFKDVLVSTGKLTLDWKWRKYTVTADLSQYAKTHTGAILHLCAFGGNVRYSCIKLESGNKPSEWTPAPEDSDTKFSTVQAQIDLKVGKNDYGQIISMINLAADDITLGGGSKINITTAGKLLISAGNFQLDGAGNVTANNATLTSATLTGTVTTTSTNSTVQMTSGAVNIYSGTISDNNKRVQFDYQGLDFYNGKTNPIGNIQTNVKSGTTNYGLVFDLDYAGSYMAWAARELPGDDVFTIKFEWTRGGSGFTFSDLVTFDKKVTFNNSVVFKNAISTHAINVSSGYNISMAATTGYGLKFGDYSGLVYNKNTSGSTGIYVGDSNLPLRLIGSSVTSNGSAVTSDRRMKNSIADIDEKYLRLLDVLSAKTFRYNQYRPEIHNCGFIAQDVLSALDDVGLTAKEFGGFVDVNGDGSEFALDYSQFVPILWAAVQDIKSKLNGGM